MQLVFMAEKSSRSEDRPGPSRVSASPASTCLEFASSGMGLPQGANLPQMPSGAACFLSMAELVVTRKQLFPHQRCQELSPEPTTRSSAAPGRSKGTFSVHPGPLFTPAPWTRVGACGRVWIYRVVSPLGCGARSISLFPESTVPRLTPSKCSMNE